MIPPDNPGPGRPGDLATLLRQAREGFVSPADATGTAPPMPEGFPALVVASARSRSATRAAAWQGACAAGALLALAAAWATDRDGRAAARETLAIALLDLDEGSAEPAHPLDW